MTPRYLSCAPFPPFLSWWTNGFSPALVALPGLNASDIKIFQSRDQSNDAHVIPFPFSLAHPLHGEEVCQDWTTIPEEHIEEHFGGNSEGK